MEISLDPIIYFYTHSFLIITVSAVMFMSLGVWIGHLTWAKFKRRARAYQEECDLLRHEIASLKRRIGEETAGTAPLVLINEDAPVPKEPDASPELPGFEIIQPSIAEQSMPFATLFLKEPEASVEPEKPVQAEKLVEPEKTVEPEKSVELATLMLPEATEKPAAEPSHESLAAVVIGPKGASHHTLEPSAPPDSVVELPPVAAATNGVHPPGPIETSPVVIVPKEVAPKVVPSIVLNEGKKNQEETSPTLDAKAAFASEIAEGTAVEDPTLGILLHSQPDRWDDLTLLRGVGEVLQQRLHDNGVHTFKQIAYWTEENVVAFSAKIEARDRIHRERWVSQARDMHFLKYGEKLG